MSTPPVIPSPPPERPPLTETPSGTDRLSRTDRPPEAGSARRPGVLAAGLLLLTVATLPAFVVRADPANPPFQDLDDQWLAWMGGPHDGPYAVLAAVLNWFGGPLGVVVPLALLFFLLVRGRWVSVGFLLGVYLAGNLLVVQGLKHLVDRPRPANPLVRVDHGSFPSGHAAGAALLVVLAGVLLIPAARRRAWWLGGVVFTLAMMWSRTWLHAHWLTDTAAGAAAGAGAGLLAWWLCAPALAREAARDRRGAAAAPPDAGLAIP
ncbi:phosphatase PAP2 family protein [Streptomyces sp. NBC_00572]|uniref:phosphatase PAP2 family protein n=1 Tax=Streptomyces sp. NBC_00572 TaxID=2903664 RepID=UPI002251249C|nr:phosphatase PAP2 family protein [Streptomyces sp. NBC_00572]MCX4985770.1 phosphatase PAP2 family protein [Streptomyces sp. NBC_00572]